MKRGARERQADHGLRSPRVPSGRPSLARAQAHREGARRGEHRRRRGARSGRARVLQERIPERVLATNVEYYSAVVLDVAEIPPPLAPAMFACSRVAGWSAHILEQKLTGRLFRPSARYVGPEPRSLGLTLAEAAAKRRHWLPPATRRRSPRCGASGTRTWRCRPGTRTSAFARRPTGRSAQFRFRQKIELLRRGLEDDSPACRGSALVALESLSRDHPGVANQVRPKLHTLADSDRTRPFGASRSSASRTRSPQPDTIRCSRDRPRTTSQTASCATSHARSPSSSARSPAPRRASCARGRRCGR